MIKDSGQRTEFESGAQRDIQKGKGRCDLLPLDVIEVFLNDAIVHEIKSFVDTGNTIHLKNALAIFVQDHCEWDDYTMVLETSKHFEDGAEKYGEYNWQKGLPATSYINSGIRHYLKWKRGDADEPHDRAFCWNMLCCWWTCWNKPELNSYITKSQGQLKSQA